MSFHGLLRPSTVLTFSDMYDTARDGHSKAWREGDRVTKSYNYVLQSANLTATTNKNWRQRLFPTASLSITLND